MPVRSNIAPEDSIRFDAHSSATKDEALPFSALPFCATFLSATTQGATDLNTKPFSALSVHAESCDNNLHLNLSKADQRSIDSAFKTSSNLSGLERPHYFNLKLLLWVMFGHGLLLFLLIFLWRTQSEHLGLHFTESSANARTTTKALKAYFIYAPPTQTAPADSAQDISVEEFINTSEPITSPPNTVKPAADIEQSAKVSPKVAVKLTPKPMEQIAKPPEVSAQESKVTESKASVPNTSVPNTSTQGQTQQSSKEAVKPKKAEVQSSSAHAASTQQSAASGQSGGAAGSVGLFTQRYFERQREQALDDLVLEQANHYSKRSNLSEMSPEMEVLIVPNADDFSGPTSLDLELDPNRIVRQGNTCYRVVKVGTPINPYAENLGFPFDCSGKKMNQEIDDAIKAQLDKMMVKRPKG
ncbi:hypothetical protein AYI92_02475 [Shewanella xiamenensis]|uniref:hypothetical protein n=1 Tax=Shewanella xiamenensis TaxID=332186 RepID=UPI001184C77B|nr:hypothetical protein AYI90_11390 [Shewanella xiamenensis]TVL23512.1 hypothetical protein AYI91_03790 [Shewanella xiamenensis]TVL28806.1 hypothetical protein AYI92_02475 [Shewanella xiamenensis]TVL31939.1 hypothetical protein AYI93_12245 [Shewanella xiamenensis]TVP01281.1 hypothetical protein AYI89_11955 [Shewanella xiamenensis]